MLLRKSELYMHINVRDIKPFLNTTVKVHIWIVYRNTKLYKGFYVSNADIKQKLFILNSYLCASYTHQGFSVGFRFVLEYA